MSIYGSTDEILVFAYWGSHVYPENSRGEAYIDLAEIAGFIIGQGTDSERELDAAGYTIVCPYLRLSLDTDEHTTVVLNEEAVVTLRDALNHWLGKPKVANV